MYILKIINPFLMINRLNLFRDHSFLLIHQDRAIYFIIFDTRRVWSILVNRSGLYSRIPSMLDADAPIDFTGEERRGWGIREDKGVEGGPTVSSDRCSFISPVKLSLKNIFFAFYLEQSSNKRHYTIWYKFKTRFLFRFYLLLLEFID